MAETDVLATHGPPLPADRTSFTNILRAWFPRIRDWAPDTTTITLVGHKCDLEDHRQVTFEEGQQLAAQMGQKWKCA